MAFLRDFIERVKTFCASVLDYCKDFGRRLFSLGKGKNGSSFLKGGIQNLIPRRKWLLVIICAACAFAVAVGIGAAFARKAGKEERPVPPEGSWQFAIPPEEIFLPDEPDFIPGVLLGREKRASWTDQDAAVFWQDPLKEGEERWREKIETAIDEFMERVP
jgi:hypothetical protein